VYYDRPPEVVVLRHSSFYEFFRGTDQSGPISVNVERIKINFLYVLLRALHDKRLPTIKTWTGELRDYEEGFMHTHFMHAIPENAGRLHGEISTLLTTSLANKNAWTGLLKRIVETSRQVLLLPREKYNQRRRVLA
jgi:hypothetical protein